MHLTLSEGLPAATVFLQGILSFFSPCVLPLLPVYFGYLSGARSGQADADKAARTSTRAKTLINTVCFVLGIGAAFFLLGFTMTALGRVLARYQTLIARVGGVLVILLRLYQLGVFGLLPFVEQERRLPLRLDRLAASPAGALVLGFVFSFAWTPCVGPSLASVLLLAASQPTRSMFLILCYTLGFALPFLAVGLFADALLALLKEKRGIVKYTQKIGALLLIVIGILMLSGTMGRLSGALAASGTAQSETSAVSEAAQNEPAPAREAEDSAAAAQADLEERAGEEMPAEPEAEEESGDDYAAYDFTLSDQYGNSHTLSDYRGKVVFLNFWATWCPPCRAEMPDIQALYEELSAEEDSEVVVLSVAFPGLSGEKDAAGVRAFLEENGYTYPVLMDASGELMQEYFITAFPTTFLIDREGDLFGYVPGAMPREFMDDAIRQTLESTQDG